MGEGIALRSARGRGVLVASVLGSGLAFLDGTVVNVALPTLERALHADLAGLQWTVDAYLLTLSALLLVGGSLGDLHGRRRMFVVGVGWFAVASAACGAAPSISMLALARAVQGIGAALLVPGSLAVLRTAIRQEDQGQAIGIWAGLSGVTSAAGPLLGGWLVQAISWRAIFLINLPLALVTAWIALRFLPTDAPDDPDVHLDVVGALLAALGIGGTTYALIEGPGHGWSALPVAAGALGVLALAAFILVEARARHPMLPLDLFRSHAFTAANITTLTVYTGLGASLFFLALELQQVLRYSPLAAGAALLPITALMLSLSPAAGRFSQRVGARVPMTVGPLVAAAGFLLFLLVHPGGGYVSSVLPGVLVLGMGLTLTVAPLTTAVLEAVEVRRAGVASGVNNAIARLAGLFGVALIPSLAGLTAGNVADGSGERFTAGFHRAMAICAGLCVAGAVSAAIGVPGKGSVPRRE